MRRLVWVCLEPSPVQALIHEAGTHIVSSGALAALSGVAPSSPTEQR